MNLDQLVKQDSPPWAPSPDIVSVDVWHEFDLPTAGTFVSHNGYSVLFTLVGEPDDRLTVWAYLRLSVLEAKRLAREPRSFPSTEAMDREISEWFTGRQAVFALADGLKISRWTPLEVKSGIVESATDFLRGIRQALDQSTAPSTRFRAELAGVEIETDELVDA